MTLISAGLTFGHSYFSFGNQQKLYLFKTCFTFLSKKRIKKKNKKSSDKVFGFIFGKCTISSSCEIITFL